MTEPILSVAAARALHLAAQGLLRPPRPGATPSAMLDAIRRMALLQIDTISVVARSPYFVLWSRLGHYDPAWLDAALADGQLFEYWAHEACFIPIEDYGLYRHRMLGAAALGWKYAGAWMAEHPAEVDAVLAHIRTNGPARSADFERTDGLAGGWWAWKPEKRALEALFTTGQLMIARRQQFHRVYDLAERVLPGWSDAGLQTLDATGRALTLAAVRALGVAKAAWIPDYHRTKPPHVDPHALADDGLLLRARVNGWHDPVFVHPDHAGLLADAAAGALSATATSLLSPFDPIVWDRRRALELFGFDYRIECYTPAARRQHGYFTLPLLRRGALIGRIDAKAHRKSGVFELKAVWLEPGVRMSARLVDDIAGTVRRCARWHGCAEVVLTRAEPDALAAPLRAALSFS